MNQYTNTKRKRNMLNQTHPNLVPEWDQERNGLRMPSDYVAGSGVKVYWLCRKCGTSWQAPIERRALDHSGCPACSGRIPIEGTNDFATLYPDIAAEWDTDANGGRNPSEFLPKSQYMAHWKCTRGHTWTTRISTRVQYTSRCPYCAGTKPIVGETDLATTHPDLVAEWDYGHTTLAPQDVTAGSDKMISWKCPRGHTWSASISNRVKGKGCPYCNHKRAWPGETDMATLYPEVAREWDYERNGQLRPEQFLPGSGKKVYWICPNCGMSYKSTIAARCHGISCPYDAGKLPIPGVTDLATTHPGIAAQWHPVLNRINPTDVTSGSERKVWWKCSRCGHEWMAYISSRTYQESRCPACRA